MDISSQQPLHHRHSHFFAAPHVLETFGRHFEWEKRAKIKWSRGIFISKQILSFFPSNTVDTPHQKPPNRLVLFKVKGIMFWWAPKSMGLRPGSVSARRLELWDIDNAITDNHTHVYYIYVLILNTKILSTYMIHMYTYTHTHIYTYVRNTYVCMRTHTCIYTYIYIHTCAHK